MSDLTAPGALPFAADLATGPVEIRNALDLERTEAGWLPRRLPAWTKAQLPDESMDEMVAQPSGVRLAFRSAADTVELDVLATHRVWRGFPGPRRTGGFDLTVDGRVVAAGETSAPGQVVVLDETGVVERLRGTVGTVRFAGLGRAGKDLELWLPHHTRTELVALRADAPIEAPTGSGRARWTHYGSSISHCAEADRPTGTWPAVAARLAGVELVNLGFGGNAHLDPFVARTIRDLPAEAISLKLGVNVVNADTFRLRAFGPALDGFLDTVRDGHPGTPLLLVSPIICPPVEDRPGPTRADPAREGLWFTTDGLPAELAQGKLSVGAIRGVFARVVARRSAHDPNLHLLDGRALFGEADLADLPDNLHPNAAGYRRMGERFARLAFGPAGPFAGLGTA